jgi:hypothetical protein
MNMIPTGWPKSKRSPTRVSLSTCSGSRRSALAEHVVNHPLQQMAALQGGVGTGRNAQPAHHRVGRLGRLPIDREVVLAAELIVPDAGGVGITRTDWITGVAAGRRRRFG